MDEREEAAYMRGRKAVLGEMLGTALRGLGGQNLSREDLLKERADAIAALRNICDDHGDNDWSDGLYLSDIISKHLGDYLDS